jgi:hypothetical protein
VPNKNRSARQGGRLKIGDDWNAITIIALSQQNPLKAVAELVENSIDAGAANVIITRGREHGEHFLRIADDGSGIPRNEEGSPDFQYVATHICDSIKRRLDPGQRTGIQGEYGIGLLSFWTLGEELTLTSASSDGRTWEMRMRKGNPSYAISERHRLFPEKGTEVTVRPLLAGIRQLSGEKMQWYLSSELRDRIRRSSVRIEIIDRTARARYRVTPREFTGQLLHQLPPARTPFGEIYVELYLADPDGGNKVGLYRHGTRVIEDLTTLEPFHSPPWTLGYAQGIIDAPFLTLTPGTRSGLLLDDRYAALCEALAPVTEAVSRAIEEQRRAEEDRASREILRSIQRAFREAMLNLPVEEYDWFEILDGREGGKPTSLRPSPKMQSNEPMRDAAGTKIDSNDAPKQREFFDFPGPLYSIVISPSACTMPVATQRNFHAIPRDRSRRLVDRSISLNWHILEGAGELDTFDSEIAVFRSGAEPGIVRLGVTAREGETECSAEALITVTDQLMPEESRELRSRQGLPAYTFKRAPGELWRSRFEAERNLIIINNTHRDFVFASRTRALKLRYICRLYVKELLLKNFPGYSPDRLLERMVELALYTEEHLR